MIETDLHLMMATIKEIQAILVITGTRVIMEIQEITIITISAAINIMTG